MKHEARARQAERLGVRLSPLQLDQLAATERLLQRIAIPRGMIATADAPRLWERHILDALRGAPELPAAASVADIGSGAGLPGLPLAIAEPTASFVLIEPRAGRAAFLEAAVEELELSNVRVFPKRVEDARGVFQVCVARAFASPLETWAAASRRLVRGGVLIYWAGERFDRGPLDDAGVRLRLSTHSDLARTGPLVIMGPQ